VWPSALDGYRLIRPLGSGRAVLAHDLLLDRPVVLRFASPLESGSQPADRGWLERARRLAGSSHPSLPRVHRIVKDAPTPYAVIDYVRGPSLEESPARWGDVRLRELGRALAGALAALHRSGLAHGDLRARKIILADGAGPCLVGTRVEPVAGSIEQRQRDEVACLLALLAELAAEPVDRGLEELHARAATGTGLAAEEVEAALGGGEDGTSADPGRNPYRGLLAFGPEHRAIFFGRRDETAAMLARLGATPCLVVAGRSGAGKSSLVRAGLGPVLGDGRLGERARWDVATMVPGRHPVRALHAALAPVLRPVDLEAVAGLSLDAPPLAQVATSRERGLVLLVDQLEEVFTLTSPADRRAFLSVLARWTELAPGLRLVATIRSDFLPRLGEERAAADLVRFTMLLGPMTPTGLRDAIVLPARARGVDFESTAQVSTLADQASAGASLPLLSFVLAELWEQRDTKRRLIPAMALQRLGGVGGALARHAEEVLAALPPEERREARRILLSLHTPGRTRMRRSARDLLATGAAAQGALAALVRGRLLVAGDEPASGPVPSEDAPAEEAATTYELAHETLTEAWPRLRAWLDEISDVQRVAARLVAAAREWTRLGRETDGLWDAGRLRDLNLPGVLEAAKAQLLAPPPDLSTGGAPVGSTSPSASLAGTLSVTPPEAIDAFVTASGTEMRRRLWRRRRFVFGLPALLVLAAASTWAAFRATKYVEAARRVTAAEQASDRARRLVLDAQRTREEALSRFDGGEHEDAEALWRAVLDGERRAELERTVAVRNLDEALTLEPASMTTRAAYADVLLERLRAAERARDSSLATALRSRLAAFDDGSRAALLAAPARLSPAAWVPDETATRSRDKGEVFGLLTPARTADGSVRDTCAYRSAWSQRT